MLQLCVFIIALFCHARASHQQASQMKGGQKRNLQTAIINKAIERVHGETKGNKAVLKVTEDCAACDGRPAHRRTCMRRACNM